jgi:GNAT superfamily N-acetyltransferase
MAPRRSMPVTVGRAVGAEDRRYLRRLWLREWGGVVMLSGGRRYQVDELPALIAWRDGRRAGALVYRVTRGSLEIVSMNAHPRRRGIGSALMTALLEEARARRARRIWLVTSNDNLDAARFYQARGFRLVAVRLGAVDRARRDKPSIPIVGHYGLPIHDEWVFQYDGIGGQEAAANPD